MPAATPLYKCIYYAKRLRELISLVIGQTLSFCWNRASVNSLNFIGWTFFRKRSSICCRGCWLIGLLRAIFLCEEFLPFKGIVSFAVGTNQPIIVMVGGADDERFDCLSLSIFASKGQWWGSFMQKGTMRNICNKKVINLFNFSSCTYFCFKSANCRLIF